MTSSSINNTNRLVLGTAQFGMNYGVANIHGKPDQKMVDAIIDRALKNNICEFDTAQAYGESESVLGEAIANQNLKGSARIISKLSLELNNITKSALQDTIFNSIRNLQVKQLYGLMLHREDQLELWDNGLENVLSEFVKNGLVRHLGVSVYTPQKALQALNCKNLSIIQIPSNILDNRFFDAGVFEKADRLNKTIYVRSVFLQGLVFMKILPENMAFASDYHNKVVLLAEELDISVCELSLWYVREAFPKAKIVIGVDSLAQLQKNIDYWTKHTLKIDVPAINKKIGKVPTQVINPALW